MGAAPHRGVDRGGASFELDRLELDDGCLVVRGWWFGVRGVRFVRPGLVVDGRRVLATLEHKPWIAGEDGGWTAAFPWKTQSLDVEGVSLVVAPSVEVPLDRGLAASPASADPPRSAAAESPRPAAHPPLGESVAAESRRPAARGRLGGSVVAESRRPAGREPLGGSMAAESRRPAGREPRTVIEEVRAPLRDELEGFERQLDAMHAELREARTLAGERDARCRELEAAVARERRAAVDARDADDEFVRAHAMAVLDRDRALARHAEAVNDREAAARAHTRMERQRAEALAACEAAEARRDGALAERDEARKQRDELLLAYEALRAQLKAEWADESRAAPAPAPALAGAAPDARVPAGGARAVRVPAGAARAPGVPAGGVRAVPTPASGAHAAPAPPVPWEADARTAPLVVAPPAGQAREAPPRGAERATGARAVPSRTTEDRTAPLPAAGPATGARAVPSRETEDRTAPLPAAGPASDAETPIGVRTIPAARTVAASLHRSKREREHGVTQFDMWAIRILGSVAALAFISLLAMILKAFFVF